MTVSTNIPKFQIKIRWPLCFAQCQAFHPSFVSPQGLKLTWQLNPVVDKNPKYALSQKNTKKNIFESFYWPACSSRVTLLICLYIRESNASGRPVVSPCVASAWEVSRSDLRTPCFRRKTFARQKPQVAGGRCPPCWVFQIVPDVHLPYKCDDSKSQSRRCRRRRAHKAGRRCRGCGPGRRHFL